MYTLYTINSRTGFIQGELSMLITARNAGSAPFAAPDAALWQQLPATTISLMGTPVAMQPSGFVVNTFRDQKIGVVPKLLCKAAHNGSALALYLEWSDQQPDTSLSDNDRFPDGAAVMFPLKGDATLMTMGSEQQPVNAWHWKANHPKQVNNNIATGFGSTYVTKDVGITASAKHSNGRWQLVLSRTINFSGSNSISLALNQPIKIAFAVWEGSNGERGGLKSFSPEWHTLLLADGGAP